MWRVPIVLGPMANAAGGALAGAVSRAGGLGFLGAGYYTRDTLQAEIDQARAQVSPMDGVLPVGIGFLLWRLEKMQQADAQSLVNTALAARPRALWFSYGPPGTAEAWCAYTNQASRTTATFVTASTLDEFRALHASEHVDAIVLQGVEAGGHGLGAGTARDALLLDALRTMGAAPRKRVLTAGGLADGHEIAAQLALGADAAVLGTRFLLTPEALYTDAQKQQLLQAHGQDTVRSLAFDDARGTTDWPQGIDGRGLRSPTVDEYEAVARAHPSRPVPGWEARQARYRQAMAQGETERIITWSGTGVGAMHDIVPAAHLVHRLAAEAHDALGAAQARLARARTV